MPDRDDFSIRTKELLAKRVGFRCSNPLCRRLTVGASDNAGDSVNIGVAAHICAASAGGPRYDGDMTSEERKSPENGIWLCQSCSKLIDSDVVRYTVDTLQDWKQVSEKLAIMELQSTSPAQNVEHDIELIKFYVQCFDRAAFKDHISQEGHMEDFDKAIESTILALNAGILRARDGEIIKRAEGKSAIQNPDWKEKLDVVVDILTAIRRRLKIATKEKAFSYCQNGYDGFYCFYDRELEEWFNSSREEVLKIMSSICKDIGMQELRFPRRHYRW